MIYTSNIVDIVKVKDGGAGPSLYTWIAYANFIVNAEGHLEYVKNSFSTTDSSGRTYIGVAYNKESEYESDDWNDYTWSKIQGEQGEPGKDGINGKDGQQYFIDINATEIKRFYESTGNVSFSPNEDIRFHFYTKDNTNNVLIDVGYDDSTKERPYFVSVSLKSFDSKTSIKKILEKDTTNSGTFSFKVELLDEETNGIDKGEVPDITISNSLFYWIELQKDKSIVFTYILPIGWALPDDYAKFSVTAAAIQASVDNAGFNFGADGLTISNSKGRSGIKIIGTKYAPTKSSERNTEITYYIYNSIDDTYIKAGDKAFKPGVKYYIKAEAYQLVTTDTPEDGVIYYIFENDSYKEISVEGAFEEGKNYYTKTDYIETADIIPVDETIYYTYNEGEGQYTEAHLESGFQEGVTYYEADVPTIVFNADTYGNLSITGEIKALSGAIGGIQIENDGLVASGFSLTPTGGLIAKRGELGNLLLTGDLSLHNQGSIIGLGEEYIEVDRTKTETPEPGIDYYKYNNETGKYEKVEVSEKFEEKVTYYTLSEYLTFKIDGKSGIITIGNAELLDTLKIGSNIHLYGSNDVSNFITISKTDEDGNSKKVFSLDKNGRMTLSNGNSIITADSQDTSIECDKNEIMQWRIDGNQAEFNNIVARGSIKTAVFEYGEIQTVGGIVLIRPSSIITEAKTEYKYVEATEDAPISDKTYYTKEADGSYKEVENIGESFEEGVIYYCVSDAIDGYTFSLQSTNGFAKDDYCKIQEQNAEPLFNSPLIQITSISEDRKKLTAKFISGDLLDDITNLSIVNFGSKELSYKKTEDESPIENKIYYILSNEKYVEATITNNSFEDGTIYYEKEIDYEYGIGLNASDNSSVVPSKAISLRGFYFDNGSKSIKGYDRIILGYIPNNEVYGSIKGQYGLYADNVLVKGKLISKNDNVTSGIDSFSVVTTNAGIFSKKRGNIIFWAGAQDDDITRAPFWVDSNGNMYAGSGYFDGAIITESTIEAAKIKTATIVGTGTTDDGYALKICGNAATKAIRFYSDDTETGTEYFTLTTELLSVNTKSGIDICKNTSISSAGSVSSKSFDTSKISIEDYSSLEYNFIGFNNNRGMTLYNKYEEIDKTVITKPDKEAFYYTLDNNGRYNLKTGLKVFEEGQTYYTKIDKADYLYIGYGANNKISFYPDHIDTEGTLQVLGGFSLWESIVFNKIVDSKDSTKIIGFDIDIVE